MGGAVQVCIANNNEGCIKKTCQGEGVKKVPKYHDVNYGRPLSWAFIHYKCAGHLYIIRALGTYTL